jgi:hypothetical protein
MMCSSAQRVRGGGSSCIHATGAASPEGQGHSRNAKPWPETSNGRSGNPESCARFVGPLQQMPGEVRVPLRRHWEIRGRLRSVARLSGNRQWAREVSARHHGTLDDAQDPSRALQENPKGRANLLDLTRKSRTGAQVPLHPLGKSRTAARVFDGATATRWRARRIFRTRSGNPKGCAKPPGLAGKARRTPEVLCTPFRKCWGGHGLGRARLYRSRMALGQNETRLSTP